MGINPFLQTGRLQDHVWVRKIKIKTVDETNILKTETMLCAVITYLKRDTIHGSVHTFVCPGTSLPVDLKQ